VVCVCAQPNSGLLATSPPRAGGYDNALVFNRWAPGAPPAMRLTAYSPLTGLGVEMTVRVAGEPLLAAGVFGHRAVRCTVLPSVRPATAPTCIVPLQTDQASVQFYSGNFLDGTLPRKASQCAGAAPGANCTYQRWGAIAIEAQGYPDALHHDNFPPVVLRPGQPYKQTTTYRVFTRASQV
jgi:hypothetical protein